MAGWGTSPWGLGAWGGVPSSVSIASARAIGPRLVVVVLTGPPRETSELLDGDVLNPFVWSVTRADALLPYTVASITRRSTLEYLVALVEALGPRRVTHTVSAPTLRSASGALIVAPTSADFAGVDSDATRIAEVSNAAVDLRNPATPGRDGARAGSLRVGTSGDYELHSGPELWTKLLLRRLETPLGAFPHLPGYGLGVRPKEPYPSARLPELVAEVERQLSRERGVESARASVTITRDGQLRIAFTARANGEPVAATTTIGGPDA